MFGKQGSKLFKQDSNKVQTMFRKCTLFAVENGSRIGRQDEVGRIKLMQDVLLVLPKLSDRKLRPGSSKYSAALKI